MRCITPGLRAWAFWACLLTCACSKSPSSSPSGIGTPPASGAGASGSSVPPSAGTAAPSAGSTSVATSGRSAAPAAGTSGATPGRGNPSGRGTAGAGTASGAAGALAAGSGSPASAGTGSAGSNAGGSAEPPPPASGQTTSVLQYHNNATRDGLYIDAAFTRDAASKIKKDTTFKATMTGDTYAQPLYFANGPGGKDLVITATEQNEVTAFDAAGGAVVWRKVVAPPAQNATSPCGNITPLGITGTPVIDAQSRTLYVDAVTTGPKNQVFALSLEDGSTRAGFPIDIDAVKGSAPFDTSIHNQRGALLLLDNVLYVPFGGRAGDCGNYNGWVIGVPLDNPTALISFATRAIGSGIWAPGGLASDGTSVYAATGNSKGSGGGFGSSPAMWGHGDAILRLGKDLKTIPDAQTQDFFATENWAMLDQQDLDLGGSGPVLFTAPGSTPSALIMALGKDGAAYLIDRANLGGMGGMIQRKMLTSGGFSGAIIQAAVAYTTPSGTFVTFRAPQNVMGCANGSGVLGAIKVSGSPPSMTVTWCAGGNGSSSPMVTSSDGMSESVVWYMAGGKLLGFNGETGAAVYTGGGSGDALGTVNKFQTAIAAKGRIFIAAGTTLHAFTPQ